MTSAMPDVDPAPVDVLRAGLRGKRIALTLVIVVAVVFIGASALQIVPSVFGVWVTPLPAAAAGSDARVCAEGVTRLARALDRARPAAGSPSFDEQLLPEWADATRVHAACGSSAEGLDAWAALQRLRSGEEQLAGRDRATLDPLRRDVVKHLPPDLR
jgi:hypothetical protein